ncbi:MAG: hypothetical protein HY921_03370 [Elusimicrobia bacterium]|nr:hypothetical protein [Elusimicrobiota bacterium]
MKARLHWWLHEWDWRPMARLIVWLAIAVAAAKRSGYQPPSLGAIARELVLGCLLTFGLLTRLQLWIALGALRLFLALDDWTYAAAEWLVRPVAGRAPFAVNFLAALAAQLALVWGSLAAWRAAHLGPRVLGLLEVGARELVRLLI